MAVRSSLTVEDWRRLNRLLEQALEIDPVERSGWIDALPSESTHLRSLLMELLEQSRGTGFATGIDPHTTVARLASEALAAMRREQPGDRIGPWQLERLLAEGGMGTVWVAQRADGVMQRTAALKLPRAEWIDRGLTERIARERAILALLQHPHIAVLYDAGVTERGRPYLALEYVVGLPIDVYCRSSAVSLTDVLRLFVQVVRAVAYAHSRLVIHRDLKPSNVLVTGDGMPKLLDFGISKLLEGDALTGDASVLTRLSGRPLTPAYAAPEQILGLPISVAADVYALGIMLFELTTGTRLYGASTPRELEEEVVRGEPRRPSAVAENKTRARALRGDLDAIILTALKRQPDERYQSAAMLADDLERYLAGEPVRAQPDRRSYRLRKFVLRNKLAVSAGSAIMLALGIGLGVALWQASLAREQATRATAMNTFVLSLIQQADPQASQQTKSADLAMLAAIEKRIDTEFKGSPDQLLQLRVSVGDAYRNRGELAAARRVFKRAIDDAAPRLPADNLSLLRARVRATDFNLIVSLDAVEDLGKIIERLRPMGREGADLLIDAFLIREQLATRFHIPAFPTREGYRNHLVEAYEVATRHFGEGSRPQLKVASRHAWLIARGPKEPGGDDRPDALRLLEHVLGQARQRPDFNASSVEYLDALGSYAFWLCDYDRPAEGIRILWDITGSVRNTHGAASLQLEMPLSYLGACLRNLGDPEAPWFSVRAYEVAAAREQPPSSNLMRRAEVAFITLVEERRLSEAKEFLDKAMKNSEAFADGPLRKKFVDRLQPNRVQLLAWLGEAEQAESLAAPMVAAIEAVRPIRMTPHQIGLWLGLSFAQRENGRFDEAIGTAAKLEEICREQKWDDCLFPALVARALAELASGRTGQALESVERALKFQQEFFVGDPWSADVGVAVSRIFLANGKTAEAVEPLRQAYGFWLGHDPKSVWAAEAEYWFGRAYLANGDLKRGRWMVAEAQRALSTSKLKSHRALASNSEAR